MILDFRLNVFKTVADKLSFTKAAHALCITQPAVTKHINELEKQVGLPLFHRHGSTISLTKAGELLLSYAHRILSLYHGLDEELGTLHQHQTGHLRIGASTTIAQYILPRILAAFKKRYPAIQLTLINDNTEKIEQLLTESQIDLGLIEGNANLPQLHYKPFVNDALVLVCSTANKALPERTLAIEDLKQVPLVIREAGSGTLDVLEEALARHHVKRKDLQIEMQLGSSESIKQYLLHTNAAAFLSEHTIQEELAGRRLRIIDVPGFAVVRTLHFISLHGQHARLPRLFLEFCLRSYNQK